MLIKNMLPNRIGDFVRYDIVNYDRDKESFKHKRTFMYYTVFMNI